MRALLLAVLLLAPAALAAPELDALLPRPASGSAGEFVRLANHAEEPAPLEGWALASGRRALALHGEVPAHGTWALARDADAYQAETGALPDAVVPLLPLADDGGSLALTGPDARDEVAWGPMGMGMTLTRAANGTWTERHVGWTEAAALAFRADVAPFTRHDALPTVLAALASARRVVEVEVYELTSLDLSAALAAAAARGVQVRILVEGAPVGGLPEGEVARLDGLAAAGAEVRTIGGSGQDRYSTVHAKFAVIDDALAIVGSENWGSTGYAPDGRGNRGWGALVRGPALAGFLADVWAQDADVVRADVRAWLGRTGEPLEAPPPGALPAFVAADLTALLAPDSAAPAILALPARATRTLAVEYLQLPLAWPQGPSPLVQALRDAAARGVQVRILLDGQDLDNAATAANLTAQAAARGWSLEVRTTEFRVHNKGMLVDASLALVSSVNGGEASMLRNREAALLVEGPAVRTYAQAFEEDWSDAAPAEAQALSPLVAAPPLFVLAALAVLRSRRS
ncbi:MAG: phospholipase D-like domain-containing protein [Halobacteriales archaeon]|nr:phospholipase D-like domain-containing protein [Halobacteriales archaeon]